MNRRPCEELSGVFPRLLFRSSRPRIKSPGNKSVPSEEAWAVAVVTRMAASWNGRGNGVCGFPCSADDLELLT